MKTPLSIQLYSLRTLPTLQNILDTVKSAGYRHVELIGSHLDNAASVKQALDERGLSVSSAHVGIAALRERFDLVMQTCKTLGFTQLFMPSVPPEERQSPEPYWTLLGRELGQMAWRARTRHELGITTTIGNCACKPMAGPPCNACSRAQERAAEMAGRVAWLVRGEADPVQWLERYQDRIVSVHAKDPRHQAPRATRMVGRTSAWGVGLAQYAGSAAAHGARWLVAEHDKPRTRHALRAIALPS
jgi:sugar phosphate isomerase/epimerase